MKSKTAALLIILLCILMLAGCQQDSTTDNSIVNTVATPGDFPDEYNYGSGKISDYSRSDMLRKMPTPKGEQTVLNTEADAENIQVLYLWEKDNVPAKTKFTKNMSGYYLIHLLLITDSVHIHRKRELLMLQGQYALSGKMQMSMG